MGAMKKWMMDMEILTEDAIQECGLADIKNIVSYVQKHSTTKVDVSYVRDYVYSLEHDNYR